MIDPLLKFKAQPKQKEFIEAVFSGKYNTLVYGGAMRGGKSYVCCATLLMLCLIYAGSKWVIVRESRPSLERTIIPTFDKICPQDFVVQFNRSKLIVTFANGSQIHFMEESIEKDPELNRFLGVECNGFFFEQIEEISEKLFELAYVRSMPGSWVIPGDKQPPQLILASCNPADNWVKSRFYDKYVDGHLPAKTFYLPARIMDNEVMMASGMVDEIFANLDPLSVRMFRDGDWDAFKVDAAFLYSFSKEKHVSPHISPFPDTPIILAFDFNVEPFTCIIGQHDKELLWVYEEIQIDHNQGDDLIETMCREIQRRYPSKWYIVCGDASGRNRTLTSNKNTYELIQRALRLTDHQMQVRRQNLSLKDSRTLCNSVLANFPVKIHPRCKTLVSECRAARFENGKLIKNRKEKKLDSLDAFRYMIDYAMEGFLEFLNFDK